MAATLTALTNRGFDTMNSALNSAAEIRSTIYLSGKQEIIGYFKSEYGTAKNSRGQEAWKAPAVAKVMEVTGLKKASAERHFQGKRLESDKTTKAGADMYAAVGKKLPGTEVVTPRKVSGRRARVTAKVMIKISKDKKPRPRNIDVKMDSSAMSALRHGDWKGMIDAYGGINPDEIESLDISTMTVDYL